MATDIIGILFSKDRAMQLDATLRSFFLHCLDPEHIRLKVICAASSEPFLNQYRRLQSENPGVDFIFQENFQSDLWSALGSLGSRWQRLAVKFGMVHKATPSYILFLVDDNIFVRDFRLLEITDALEQERKSIGFALQMGVNISYCYPLGIPLQFPAHTPVFGKVIKYRWVNAGNGLNYPLEVSSSIYRWKEIALLLAALNFSNPNTLEAQMSSRSGAYRSSHPDLLCYKQSVTFCNPVNKVQEVYNNKTGRRQEYSVEMLARKFESGYRIDVRVYKGLVPTACHQEIDLAFASE